MPPLQPRKIIEALNGHHVRYVLIGGLAAVLHGSPVFTNDADLCPSRDRPNLVKLADALRGMDARIFNPDEPEEGLGFGCVAPFFEMVETLDLVTRLGRLDVTFFPAGTRGFDDLIRSAVVYELKGGLRVPVASLADVIRSKEAADREKDRRTLPLLRELLDRTESLDEK